LLEAALSRRSRRIRRGIVLGRAAHVKDTFDELTDHGRKNIALDQAIQQAFSKNSR
jgi:hypothetical protein